MMVASYYALAFLLAALVAVASAGLPSQQIQAISDLCNASNSAAKKGLNLGWNCSSPDTACSFGGIDCDSTKSFITSMHFYFSYN